MKVTVTKTPEYIKSLFASLKQEAEKISDLKRTLFTKRSVDTVIELNGEDLEDNKKQKTYN